MHNKKLGTYPFYTPSKPNIHTRTRLYSLVPIGIGTAYSESLTSYIIRLAEAHSVKPGILLKHEIAPLIGQNYCFNSERYINTDSNEGGIDVMFANSSRSINSTGEWANSVVQTIEFLTYMPNLSCLTFKDLRKVLSTGDLLRKNRAWCSSCFYDWQKDQTLIYEPLIWNLNAVKICLKHETKLITKCPYCSKSNKPLGWKSRVGYCSNCANWLGVSDQSKCQLSIQDLETQKTNIENLGGLITHLSKIDSCPCRLKLSDKLNKYMRIIPDINKATFARYLGVPCSIFMRWYYGNSIPNINHLLNICSKLEVSLVDFIFEDKVCLSKQLTYEIKKHKISRSNANSRNNSKQHCKQTIIDELQKALKEFPPPSTSEVVERLNIPKSSIRFHAQSLYSLVSSRYRKYEKNNKKKKVENLLEEILKSEEYPFPSLNEISKRINLSTTSIRMNYLQLSQKLAERYLQDRSKEAEKRRNKLVQEIKHIAIELHNEGEEPLGYKISRRMNKPLTIIQDVALDALQEIRKELGYEK